MAARPELIAIVGPTASGKTSLAIRIAQEFGCEIVCADSRTVYAGMDVGTAKPTAEERASVRHWGLDLVQPDQRFSVADFKRYATTAINDIRSRGKIPLLVGGTGLYVDAVLYDYELGPPTDPAEREKLTSMTIEQLRQYCIDNNIELPENGMNKRHLVRAIERVGISAIRKSPLQQDSYIVGIATRMETLRTRIVSRSEQLFQNDVVQEATLLGKKYGWECEAMTGNIYPLIKSHLEGELTLEETKERFTTLDYRLAKRQMTWLRRNPDIMWCSLTEAETYLCGLFAAE
jgi:tRNA dimethylallyltransferase